MGTFHSPPPWDGPQGAQLPLLPQEVYLADTWIQLYPNFFGSPPTLLTCPTVAKQFWDTKRTSSSDNLKAANLPPYAINFHM
jgi:hypothetical protein